MTSLADGEIALTNEWLYRAGDALSAFFKDDAGCFLRSTGAQLRGKQRESPFGEGTGATSSNRAFLASTELLFALCEEQLYEPPGSGWHVRSHDARWLDLGERLRTICSTMATGYYQRPLDEVREQHSENGKNDFTDAHLLVALSTIRGRFFGRYVGIDSDRFDSSHALLRDSVVDRLDESGGARISPSGPNHPFITLHAVRSAEVAFHTSAEAERSRVEQSLEARLRESARDEVLRQIGLHACEDAEFDPGALVGGIALLHRFAGMSGHKLVERGVELLATTQGFDGSWKSRVLTGDARLVYIPSLEIGCVLANIALADLAAGSRRVVDHVQPIIDRCLGFLEAGYVERAYIPGEPTAGWANDQVRQPDAVESWSTALAAQLLVRARRIWRRSEQLTTLRKYRVHPWHRPRAEWLRWADLAGPIALVRSQQAEADRADSALRRVSDPTPGGSVLRAIREDVVLPTLDDAFDRPPRTSAFLLYGPPGTRKSSLVGAVAEALDWPLVTLSPPDFLQNGIVGLEAKAAEIFRDLQKLRRVVVFFDECEELFRRRTVVNAPEHRTQSDFITSGMLPRLQELKDERWVVFAIATNTELDEIDPAVARLGRMDGQERIGHPTIEAQVRYLTEKGVDDAVLRVLATALGTYDRWLEHEYEPTCRRQLHQERRDAWNEFLKDGDLKGYFAKAERVRAREAEMPQVTFAILDLLARDFADASPPPAEDSVAEALRAFCNTKGRPLPWSELYPYIAET